MHARSTIVFGRRQFSFDPTRTMSIIYRAQERKLYISAYSSIHQPDASHDEGGAGDIANKDNTFSYLVTNKDIDQ